MSRTNRTTVATGTIAVTNIRIPRDIRQALATAAAGENRTLSNYLLTAGMERLVRADRAKTRAW